MNVVLTLTQVPEVWLLQQADHFCAASSGPVFLSYRAKKKTNVSKSK